MLQNIGAMLLTKQIGAEISLAAVGKDDGNILAFILFELCKLECRRKCSTG